MVFIINITFAKNNIGLQKSATISNFPSSLSPLLQHIRYSSDMFTEKKLKCDQCGMVFPSDRALYKHKRRFCIGVKDSGIGRKPIYSDDEEIDRYDNHTKQSAVKNIIPHQSSLTKKREELGEWKRQRAILQTVKDMENRIPVDPYTTQKLTDNIKKQDNIYNEILREYERLRIQEQDVLRHMYTLQTELPSLKNSNIKLTETNDLTDNQKNQFEELQRENNRLKQERRIIQKKLEELISTNDQLPTMANYEQYRLLNEMNEQQQLNEKALEFLRGAYMYSHGLLSTESDIRSLPYINPHSNYVRRSDGDNVRSFRQKYLQSGGHDPRIIAGYSDLEYKLRSYGDYPWSKNSPEPLRQARYPPDLSIDPTAEQLKLFNEENQQLKSELDDINQKVDTLDTRTRRLELSMATNGMPNSTDDHRYVQPKVELYPQSQLSTHENNNNDQFYQRQPNHYTSLPDLHKRVTPRASPAINLLDSNMYKLRDSLAPRSYEPTGGFVIYFDFILNLPSTVGQCCLLTSLHHPKCGLGEPSLLEPIKCDQYIDDKTGQRMNIALIAIKQPVLRCPPQQALTVVIEIQTSTDRQARKEELRTSAWVKLPLFDNKNRLSSGRWKAPLKALPIHYNESLAVISRLPSYEHAELHYRLVNSQDDSDQSNAPFSPRVKDLYAYPTQYRN